MEGKDFHSTEYIECKVVLDLHDILGPMNIALTEITHTKKELVELQAGGMCGQFQSCGLH